MNKFKLLINKHAERVFFGTGKETLEQVKKYNYLVQTVSVDRSNQEKEIRLGVGMGWRGRGKHSQLMKSKIPLSLKRKIYNQHIRPVMTHGAETCHISKQLESKLRPAQRGMDRIMTGVTRKDWKRASWIRERTRVEDIAVQIK